MVHKRWKQCYIVLLLLLLLLMMMMHVTEVEAVLSESRGEDDSCATLARLKMAIEYEEKKVSNETKSTSTLL